ncbi:PrsW family glutamic-type intramembrane protease [Periweissella cryptocerci]|nr:PrsW family glutamic-type intramembrane protease [Periweissella cryptocerci]
MPNQNAYGNAAKSVVNSATSKLNEFTGESGAININLKDLFSEVGKKHTNAEADEVFIAGTSKTTPDLANISENWSRPWLFSRFFMGSLVAFIALFFASTEWQIPTVSAGLILIGAFAVPVTGLIFFFESNAFKNFSIFETLKVFFIGGVMAIFITLLLTIIIGDGDISTWSGALLVGAVEEVGKLIIIVYFVRKYVVTHILNGILIGAAVGAGFAAFETAGYIMTAWTSQATSLAFLGLGTDGSDVLGITFARAWTTLGTHMVWAAIAGGALIIAKRAAEFKMNQLTNKNFLVFFLIAVGLHTVWDKIAGSWIGMDAYIGLIALIVVAWITVFTLMNAGLKEIAHMHEKQ